MLDLFRVSFRNYLETLDPERIYVENVRYLFGVNEEQAQTLCDKAEADGFFERWVSYEHPTLGRILVEAPFGQEPEDKLYHCDVSEAHDMEKSDFRLSELRKRVFFRALSNAP